MNLNNTQSLIDYAKKLGLRILEVKHESIDGGTREVILLKLIKNKKEAVARNTGV